MRAPKSSDSPSGYDREVRPKLKLVSAKDTELAELRERVAGLAAHEDEIRRVENDRWARRIQALLPVVNPRPCDFEGCVE